MSVNKRILLKYCSVIIDIFFLPLKLHFRSWLSWMCHQCSCKWKKCFTSSRRKLQLNNFTGGRRVAVCYSRWVITVFSFRNFKFEHGFGDQSSLKTNSVKCSLLSPWNILLISLIKEEHMCTNVSRCNRHFIFFLVMPYLIRRELRWIQVSWKK